jgi:hypothetical protein
MGRSLKCLAVIGAADYVIRRRSPSWFQVGLLDEPAHVATAILLHPRRPSAAYLAGSVLPDLDHVPLAFRKPEVGSPRPRTHSLYMVVPAALLSRELAAGMLAHFVRDLAGRPGVPLLGRTPIGVPYAAYAVLVLATAYSRSRPWRAAPAHIPGASGRGP